MNLHLHLTKTIKSIPGEAILTRDILLDPFSQI